jgi:transposase
MKQATTFTSPVTIGLDAGDSKTHFCVLDVNRKTIATGSCPTTREHLAGELSRFPGAKVVLEAGSQSPWLSRFLQGLGYQVHVADPRRVQLITKDPRKSDRRDARTLALLEAGCPELLGDVHHRGEQVQADISILRARDLVVRLRTMAVQEVRSLAKVFGSSLPTTSVEAFPKKVRPAIPAPLDPAVEPLLDLIGVLTKTIDGFEKKLEEAAKERYPEAARFRAINGVGPITAMAFLLSVDNPGRFASNRKVGSWVGLCPRSHASGDQNPALPISKAGDCYLRRILVQSAQYMLGRFGQDSDLRRFGLRLVERGGRAAKRKAVVAVARKLAVRLLMLWRSGRTYDPLHNVKQRATAAAV